jgi:hypothetical protein
MFKKNYYGGTRVGIRYNPGEDYTHVPPNFDFIDILLENCEIDIFSYSSTNSFIFKLKLKKDAPIKLRSQVYSEQGVRLSETEQADTSENVNIGQEMFEFVLKVAFVNEFVDEEDDGIECSINIDGKNVKINKNFTKEDMVKREAELQKKIHQKMLCWDRIDPFSPDIITCKIVTANDFKSRFERYNKEGISDNFKSIMLWINKCIKNEEILKFGLTVMDLVVGDTLESYTRGINNMLITDSTRKTLFLLSITKMIIFTLKTGFILTDLNPGNLMVTKLGEKYQVNIIDYGAVTVLMDENEKTKVIDWFTGFLGSCSQDQIIEIAEFFNIVDIKRKFLEIGGIYKARLKQNVTEKFEIEIRYFIELTSDTDRVNKLLTEPSKEEIHRLLMIISIIGIISNAIAYNYDGNLQCMVILKDIYPTLLLFISPDAKDYRTIYYFFTKLFLNIDYNKALAENKTLAENKALAENKTLAENKALAKKFDIGYNLDALIENIIIAMSICIPPERSGIEQVYSASKSVTQTVPQTAPQILFGLAGTALGGGYSKSNHKRSIRKNKYRFSKRLNKRKNKRTHKSKYKRTNKRKYKKQ